MREFDEATVTDAGLERVANTPDLRARRLSQALVRHLHAFIWEIEPTEAEWEWEIRREMDGDWFSLEREFRLARLACEEQILAE